ncbi:MAG: outer membrane protein assembly factor BamD, partial [bacterium]
IYFLIPLFLIASCASAPPVPENPESEAEVIYKRADFYRRERKWERAEKLFTKILTDYSYSAYSSLALIGLGDTYFDKESYTAALEIYKRFLKMHPNHEKTDYALFQIGNSHFEQRPSDFFILPDPETKDLEEVEKAVDYYRRFTEKHKESNYMDKVEERLEKAESFLISREIRIANYYAGQKRCPAVHVRLDYIDRNFEVKSPEVRKKISSLEEGCPLSEEEKKVLSIAGIEHSNEDSESENRSGENEK